MYLRKYTIDMLKRYVLLTIGLLISAGAMATIRFVREDGYPKTGAWSAFTWEDACRDLQAVIDYSGEGDSIFIAEGVYTPAFANYQSYLIHKGLKIYGGFKVGETLDLRRWKEAPAVLDGRFPNGTSNHVIIALDINPEVPLLLDGLTIRNGFAKDTIKTDNVREIAAGYGGGLYSESSAVQLNNVIFSGNDGDYGGGALYMKKSSFELTNVTFNRNTAGVSGAAVFSDASSYKIVNSLFYDNTTLPQVAEGGDGILAVRTGSKSEFFINCTFADNTGSLLHFEKVSSLDVLGNPTFQNCIIKVPEADRTKDLITSSDWGPRNVNTCTFQHSLTNYPLLGINRKNTRNLTGIDNLLLTDNYVPDENSSAINHGNSEFVQGFAEDLAGNERVQKKYVDIGAYETSYKGVISLYFNATRELSSAQNADSLAYGDTVFIWHDGLETFRAQVEGSSFADEEYISVFNSSSDYAAYQGFGSKNIIHVDKINRDGKVRIKVFVTVNGEGEEDNWRIKRLDNVDLEEIILEFKTVQRELSVKIITGGAGNTPYVELGNMIGDKRLEMGIDFYAYWETPTDPDRPQKVTIGFANDNYATLVKNVVFVSPDAFQSKKYNEPDPVIAFTSVPAADNFKWEGVLSREKGESTGSYEYVLESLSIKKSIGEDDYVLAMGYKSPRFDIVKSDPEIIWPAKAMVVFGQKLSMATLTAIANVAGDFSFEDSDIVPRLSDSETTEYTYIFTPTDKANYSTLKIKLKVKIIKNDTSLSSLTVSGFSLFPRFNPNRTQYGVLVGKNIKTVSIDAVPGDPTSEIIGRGTQSLYADRQTFSIKVTAESDSTRTYTILVTTDPKDMEQFTVTGNEIVQAGLKVYPTVTTGTIYIETADVNTPEVKLYDLTGRLLFGKRENTIDLSAYPKGLYLLQVDGQTIKVTKR
ncbi:hypothetical protein Barb4_00291 [Bacteroidales bacterium Barb4]|nr:hypothetical protein Barb4_00291 [Bacteroidales bacterium Barb4]